MYKDLKEVHLDQEQWNTTNIEKTLYQYLIL